MNALRIGVLLGIAAAYAAAILDAEHPASMAVGLAPIAWIALEAGWHLFGPRH